MSGLLAVARGSVQMTEGRVAKPQPRVREVAGFPWGLNPALHSSACVSTSSERPIHVDGVGTELIGKPALLHQDVSILDLHRHFRHFAFR